MDLAGYETAIRDLAIPPRPEVITGLFEEMSRDVPDLAQVAKLIRGDPAISAGILQAANSPFFGLARKVASVQQALSVLGLRHVTNIATGIAIRQSLKGGTDGKAYEHFWRAAENTALICNFLATRLRGVPADVAFTYGLFHDCGVPVLLSRFPRYKDTLRRAKDEPEATFSAVEEDETGTSHSILGYFLSRSWGLPDDLCQAVLLHHDPVAFADPATRDAVRNLIGLGHMAEHVQNQVLGNKNDAEWEKFGVLVISHFGIDDEDLVGLIDAIGEAMHLEG